MFGIHDFGLFLATGILLNLTPGPDTVYIWDVALRKAAMPDRIGLRDLRRQSFSYLRGRARTVGNSGDLSARVWRDQVARWCLSDFSWDQNAARSAKAVDLAI